MREAASLTAVSLLALLPVLSILLGGVNVVHGVEELQGYYTYKTEWYENLVDHFGFAINSTFKQRYLINDTHWDSQHGGPIFLYAGNEGDIEAFAQNTGFMWDIAPEFNALIIFIEHRYYGKSLPFGKDSLKPDPKMNGYLTSEQALADYARFVTEFKSTRKGAKDSPVIVFGGSYGGMLAAWMRIKYPHIVNGAIAGSAPVAQFDTPCLNFGRIVTSDYSFYSKSCSGVISKSWAAIDQVGKNDKGLQRLQSLLKLCSKPKSVEPLKSFLTDVWTSVAMMNYPYPTEFLMPLPGNPVKYICGKMSPTTVPTDPVAILKYVYEGLNVYANYSGKAKCIDMDNADQIGADMWDYQSCTEMVMPFCYNNVDDMFEKSDWNFTTYAQGCQERWKVTPRPKMADIMYGSKKLKAASNIIFSNGLLDPWSSGGIMKSISDSVVSIIIPEGAHHLDLRGSNPNDPVSVIHARKLERSFIRKWIRGARHEASRVYTTLWL
uniref:Lysosomal Pro-X carboxypeptidase n=1 Tax=Caligus rogercresseyi TaxID=217165 RepID=C1BML9_CALRO|nr:Lysosomal Pro-X carboxypeptidase precursor [Caligus rogercresseyi]